jgi:glycosyltransferase involved in cell wall biosynthesis
MPPPLPISVPIIASNEARNLPRLLASVQGWVAEIVVVLNNTTDNSAEIARSYGARVETSAWLGYRDTKNHSLGLVTQPWVLALDADEEVSTALKADILNFFSSGQSEYFTGARFPRKVWFLGRWITHGDWYPDLSLRLFKHSAGKWAGSAEHDSIQLEGPVTRLKGDLYHFSNPTISSHVQKMVVFSDYFLKRQLDAGKKASILQIICRPAWRFLRAYIIRAGFLDGFPGLYIAFSTAFSTFIRYTRLYEHLNTREAPTATVHRPPTRPNSDSK